MLQLSRKSSRAGSTSQTGDGRSIESLSTATCRNAKSNVLWVDPRHVPSQCACGKCFTVEHIFSCPYGGFSVLCLNDIRDTTASLLSEVCHNVALEPTFTTLSHSPEKGSREPTLRMVHAWTSKHKSSWVKDIRVHSLMLGF